MIVGDFGTSYSKIVDTALPDRQPQVIATKELDRTTRVAMATGHNAKRFGECYVNELIALARGGETLIDEKDFVLLDCGSRDIKYVTYAGGRLADMGWNSECGASMGFTIELLGRYYDLDFNTLQAPERPFSVTCGVLGLSRIFDDVVAGIPDAEAVARFVKGIAVNAYRFAGSPARMYLSGGLCENRLFVESFPCQIISLGRFVLLEGLLAGRGGAGSPKPQRKKKR